MNYAVPLLLLVLTILAWFAIGRGGYAGFGVTQWLLRVLVALPLLASGFFLHFVRLDSTTAMMPAGFPAPQALVLLTGVLEIAGAVGLFLPRFHRSAALWIAIMMVAVFPANIYAAGKVIGGTQMPGVVPRTVAQIVYILLVLLAGYGFPRLSKRS